MLFLIERVSRTSQDLARQTSFLWIELIIKYSPLKKVKSHLSQLSRIKPKYFLFDLLLSIYYFSIIQNTVLCKQYSFFHFYPLFLYYTNNTVEISSFLLLYYTKNTLPHLNNEALTPQLPQQSPKFPND